MIGVKYDAAELVELIAAPEPVVVGNVDHRVSGGIALVLNCLVCRAGMVWPISLATLVLEDWRAFVGRHAHGGAKSA